MLQQLSQDIEVLPVLEERRWARRNCDISGTIEGRVAFVGAKANARGDC